MRSICVVFVALVEVCSMDILRFELTSLWFSQGVFAGMYMEGYLSCLGVAQ